MSAHDLIELVVEGEIPSKVLDEAIPRSKHRDYLDFNNPFSKFNRGKHTQDDVNKALNYLFQAVASDLGISSPKSDAFKDYASDAMSDAAVPTHMAKKALKSIK